MATVTERLAFIVSANADQAIRAFEKTANSAEKELGKATKKIDTVGANLTKFGARGLAATGALTVGLFSMAKAAAEDEKSQALLAQQLRVSTKATDAQVAAVEDFIDKSQRATGVADDKLRPAFQQLVRTTGSATKSQELLNLALDISAGTGKDIGVVTQALSRAYGGNIGALTRLGIPLDENIKKSKDFSAAVDVLSTRFEGQASIAADTYAGRMARTKVAIDEAKEELGRGFLPVLELGTSALTNSAGAFSKVNSATAGAAGKFATFATVGLGVVSAMSLVAGQAIKMRERFVDADGAMTKMGKTAKATSFALATVAISEAVFTALNNASGTFDKMDRSLNTLLGTFAKAGTAGTTSPIGSTTNAFREMAIAEDKVLKMSHIWTDWGKKVSIAGYGAKIPIEDVDAAFGKLLGKGGSAGAQKLVDDLKAVAAGLDKNTQGYKDTIMLIDRYQSRINSLATGQKGLLAIQTEQATADADAAAVLEAKEEATRRAEEATKKYEERIKSLRDTLAGGFKPALEAANEKLREAKDRFTSFRDSVASAVAGSYSFVSALDAIKTATDANATAQDKVSSAQNQVTDANRSARDAAWELTDAQAALAKARAGTDAGDIVDAERNLTKATERNAEAITAVGTAQTALAAATTAATATTVAAGTTFIDQLTAQANTATQFGEKIDKLLALGISEDSLQLVLAAGAEAGGKIADQLIAGGQDAVDKADALTESVKQAGIRAGNNAAGDFYTAGVTTATSLVSGIDSVLKKYKVKLQSKGLTDKQLKKLQKNFKVDVGFEFASREFAIPEMAEGGIVPATNGGRLIRVAEAGQAEAIIPLSRFNGGGGGGDVYHIEINSKIADATLPDLLVAELRKFNRRSGAINIQVA